MNKKLILVTAIAACTIGAIAYIKTRPTPMTVCESLLWKMAQSKTQAEHDYAEKQWRSTCLTNQP